MLNLVEVRERLKASKAQRDAQLEAEGRELGVAWAADCAEAHELKAIAELAAISPERDWIASAIAAAVVGDDGWEMAFCAQAIGDWPNEDDEALLIGFVRGAAEVWEAVAL